MTRVDRRPLYIQVSDDLRQSIASGALTGKLSPATELATAYGVSTLTIYYAIRVLRDEGLIEVWHRRGTFVRPWRTEPRPLDAATQIQDLNTRVEELWSHVKHGTIGEIPDLWLKVSFIQAELIALYAQMGQPYPRDHLTKKIHARVGQHQQIHPTNAETRYGRRKLK